MKNISINLNKQYNLSLLENVTCVEHNDRFIRDVFDHEDLDYYKYFIDNNTPESFSTLYQLDIKISKVGKMSFFFLKKDYNNENVINKIQDLKNFEITDNESKKIKVNKLLEIVGKENALFGIFISDELETLSSSDFDCSPINIIFVKPDLKKLAKANKKHGIVGKYFIKIGKEKLIVLFSFISALIISFVSALGIYNCYPNNAVYIFFFICAAAATALNFFIYRDIQKKYQLIDSLFFTSLILNILGVGGGIGIFVGYYSALKNIPEVIPSLGTLSWISILVSLILLIISIGVSILLNKLIKKK